MPTINGRYIPILLVLIAGILLSVMGYQIVRYMEFEDTKARFFLDAQNRFYSIKRELEVNLEAIQSLKSFYVSSEEVTREEFRKFTVQEFLEHKSVQALQWIPRIPFAQRELYEQMARQDGYPEFQITNYAGDGRFVMAGAADEYFPVYFIEPYSGNEKIFGFNLSSSPLRLEAMQKARDTGMISVLSGLELIQAPGSYTDCLVFLPIYEKHVQLQTVEDRRRHIAGFVLGVFKINHILENALSFLEPSGIDLQLYDVTRPQEKKILYKHDSRVRKKREDAIDSANRIERGLQFSSIIDIADFIWELEAYPVKGFYSASNSWRSWGISASLLLTTFLLVAYIKSTVDRTTKVEELVGKLSGEISARKRIEKSLQQSEKKYRGLFETAGDGIMIIKIEEQRPFFMDVNVSALEIFGRTRDEMIGRSPEDFSPEFQADGKPSRVRISELFASVLNGHEQIFEWIFQKEDGTLFEVEANLTSLESSGHSLIQAIIRNITARKNAERKLVTLNRELEIKNKELEQVLYVTSHDLRSPLVNIEGFSKELEHALKELNSCLDGIQVPPEIINKITPVMDVDIPESMQFIHKSIVKMNQLITGILTLSRTGRVRMKIVDIDMNKILSAVIKGNQYVLKLKGIRTEISPLPACRGDKMQLNQLFANLIDNTIKYLDAGRPGVIKIWGRQEDGKSVYCVEDNGVGIAPEYQVKIFEIFHRLEPGRSDGEGLGLTIAQRIVELHHGEIWVESEVNKGSRFFVSIPVDSFEVRPRKSPH